MYLGQEEWSLLGPGMGVWLCLGDLTPGPVGEGWILLSSSAPVALPPEVSFLLLLKSMKG